MFKDFEKLQRKYEKEGDPKLADIEVKKRIKETGDLVIQYNTYKTFYDNLSKGVDVANQMS